MGIASFRRLSMRYGLCVLLLAVATLHAFAKQAEAAGAATGVYLLSSRAVGAGITPPPNLYFQDDTYFYSGKIGGGTGLPTGGLLVANPSSTTRLKVYREFDVQNRMEGTADYFTVAVPLVIDTSGQDTPLKPIKAKF
jgi:hypothetical protein